MGKELSYAIVLEGESDIDCEWTDMNACRNLWKGPSSYDRPFTKAEMIQAFREYVNLSDGDEWEYCSTVQAFGEIISNMTSETVVYIRYS